MKVFGKRTRIVRTSAEGVFEHEHGLLLAALQTEAAPPSLNASRHDDLGQR